MNRYVIAPEASEDLKEISRYIAKDREAPQGAKRLRSLFLEQFRLLGSQPLAGELRDDLGEKVRQWPARDYVIFYEPTDTGVQIIQVVHGARDVRPVFRRSRDR